MRRTFVKLSTAVMFVWATFGFGSVSLHAMSCGEAVEVCESVPGCVWDYQYDWQGLRECYYYEPFNVCYYTCTCGTQWSGGTCGD